MLSWHTLYPNEKDYTFYSAPHNQYSRLDYLFLTQRDLPLLTAATIDSMYLSDHHPISMSIEFADIPPRSSIWCLDPSLLTDNVIALEINKRLSLYCRENSSPDISQMVRCEAHKRTIRGELIALSAKRRRERQAHITKLTSHIHKLERTHKTTQASSSLPDLIQARTERLEILDKK